MSKPRIDFPAWILFEDEHFILINKPPFLATLEDRADPVNLLALARKYVPEAQACHRLDKETSGVLAFSKHAEAYKHLSQQFEHRAVTKIYHALVDGTHPFDRECVDQPIAKRSDGTVRLDAKGKRSVTVVTTMDVFKINSLVECRPQTGRMHQIRLHLQYLGAPISGDLTYGGKPLYLSAVKRNYQTGKYQQEQPLMPRMALHAFSLTFKSLDDKEIAVEAPYPKDFRAALRQLGQNR